MLDLSLNNYHNRQKQAKNIKNQTFNEEMYTFYK